MIGATLAQLQKSETCLRKQVQSFGCWHLNSATLKLSRDSAVVSATARPGQNHLSRQKGVLPRGQQKNDSRSGLVGLSIAKPSVYENRGLAYQTYSRLNIHASRVNASRVPPSELSPNRAPNWSWAITFIAGKSCHPKGSLATQYRILSRHSTAALINTETPKSPSTVRTNFRERSSIQSCQLILRRSAGKKAIKNSEPSPAMADSHKQISTAFSMVGFPYKGGVGQITHRSRCAVLAARKEVGNQFYLGNSTTPNIGNSSQISKVLSTADSLPSVCVRTRQSTPFNAASTANEACHGNDLARESTTFFHEIDCGLSQKVQPRGSRKVPSTIRSPIKGVFGVISHRSRCAVVAARKEVGKQFYPGDLITSHFGEFGQTLKVLSMVDSLRGDLREAWQSTSFNAVLAANEACHGNSLARESATFSRWGVYDCQD